MNRILLLQLTSCWWKRTFLLCYC